MRLDRRHRGLSAQSPARGLALPEVLVTAAVAILGVALALPAVGGARGQSMVDMSLDNLRVLGAADAAYAGDWNGRQWTGINDTLAAYGAEASQAFASFNSGEGIGSPYRHPPITLGWAPLNGEGQLLFFAYRTNGNIANARLCEPIVFDGPNFQVNGYFGSFRIANDVRYTPYIGSQFYDQRFYAPADTVVQPLIEPLLDQPFEYVDRPPSPGFGDVPYWAGYVRSAAAMFDPAVMETRRTTPDGPVGGWIDPWSLDTGMRSPAMSQARYPHLKTAMLEHHWIQGAPDDPCNPGIASGTYGGCEPYYFNHAAASAPATLFFDGSTRLLPNREVLDADAAVQAANGGAGFDGLWSRSTPFGEDGYFGEVSFDGTRVSHHVLTADGILGRDTVNPGDFDAPAAGRPMASPRRSILGTMAPWLPRRVAPLHAEPFGVSIPVDVGPHAR
jgi:hypothetical protein